MDGVVEKIFSTNLIIASEILNAPWFVEVSLSRFIALLIDAINRPSLQINQPDRKKLRD